MSILDNFFNETLEKTVFISEEQLTDCNATKLYGKYFEYDGELSSSYNLIIAGLE